MNTIQKSVDVYCAFDGKEFSTAKACKAWEHHLILNKFHKKLMQCNFHVRCKFPFLVGTKTAFIGHKYMSSDLQEYDNSYVANEHLISVRYKIKGKNVVLLHSFGYDNNGINEYLLKVPLMWLDLPMPMLQSEVDRFVERSNDIFESKIKYLQKIKY